MHVLVTRPAAQAAAWVALLRGAGLDAEALPLIEIAPAADPAALAAAWQALPAMRMVVFVSPNAATCFFDGRPSGMGWPASLMAASPGPGTTQVLRQLGVHEIVEPAADAVQFDSEALWAQLSRQGWAGQRVLVVRGAGGRDWLADRLRECGATVEFVAAYARRAPTLTGEQRSLLQSALAAPRDHVWLFSSSEAIAHLHQIAPGADWSEAAAIATHPRIALTARDLGFGDVRDARPSMEAVVACIQSIAS